MYVIEDFSVNVKNDQTHMNNRFEKIEGKKLKVRHCKVFWAFTVVFLASALAFSSVPFFATATESVSKDEALEILMKEIIKPSNLTYRLGAYMLSEPLQRGDLVSSESGLEYTITNRAWFIFIDDEPCAFYEHDVRYVFIDVSTGNSAIVDETSAPYINNVSIWDTATLNRGELIEIFTILSEPWHVPPLYNYTALSPPLGDYGDAPDGQKAYYAVNGSFPTRFNTTHSKFGRPGAHTLNVGQEMLGVSVSAEVDANDPRDPDGVQNFVDADNDERMFVIIENATARLVFDVTVNIGAPDVTRYVNVLLDFDQSGNWGGNVNGKEWAVVNMEVNVPSETTETIITPEFSWGLQNVSPVWMRVALTRERINETLFGVEGWDGSGQFEYGEIEDNLVFLMDCPPPGNLSVWWPPKSGSPLGGQGPGGNPPGVRPTPLPDPMPQGPKKGPCGYVIKYYALVINGGDKKQHIRKNQFPCKVSAERMKAVLEAQYEVTYLSIPNGDTKEDIERAIKELKNKVCCGDRVLIYIVAHGIRKSPGGFRLYGKNGKRAGIIRPEEDLKKWLDTIPPCEGGCCHEKGKCCYVTVIIESCWADHFKVLRGKGRIIATSSTDQKAYGRGGPHGGHYTRGFDLDLRDPTADKSPKDGIVSVKEAHDSAEEFVKKMNQREKSKRKDKTPQEPNYDDQTCKCICPVGGIVVPCRLSSSIPWIRLGLSILAVAAAIVYVKKRRTRKAIRRA